MIATKPPQPPLSEATSQLEQLDLGKKPQDDFPESHPPSKLLNYVKGEPGLGQPLRRLNSETQEEEQFHDAIS